MSVAIVDHNRIAGEEYVPADSDTIAVAAAELARRTVQPVELLVPEVVAVVLVAAGLAVASAAVAVAVAAYRMEVVASVLAPVAVKIP